MSNRKLVALLCATAAMCAVPTAAQAQVLFDQTDLPTQSYTPYSINFVTGSPTTTITFAGYDVPSGVFVGDILLTLLGDSTNQLGSTFSFTPAPCGSFADQSGVGASGTNNLVFAGVCSGSYDSFSQSFASTAGATYTLSFNLDNSTSGGDGLRITASNSRLAGAVPEPGTWALMLLGFGAVGVGLRRRRQQGVAAVAA